MKKKNWLYGLLVAISAVTLVSGLTQLVAPGFMLGLMASEATPTSMHFFAIVGMFMVLFGGMLLHALLSSQHHPIAVLWAGLQKFGAFAAVGLGVLNTIFSALALLVAVFDLASGFLIVAYWLSIRHSR